MAEIIYAPRGDGRFHCRITKLSPEEVAHVYKFVTSADPEPGAKDRWQKLLPDEVECLDTGLTLEQIEIAVGQALRPRPLLAQTAG